MRTLSILLTLGLASCALVSSQLDSDADVLQIREQVETWAEAWNRRDAEAIAALYDADADRTFAHGIVTSGRDAIRDMYEGNFAATLPEGIESALSLRILSVRPVTEDVAVVDYEYHATGIPVAPDLVVDGRSTVVMVKRGGVWLRAAQRNWIPTTPECMRLCQEHLSDYPSGVKD